VVNAVIMWFSLGPQGTFTPYLVGNFIGAIPVYLYLFVSVVLTAVFLGGTSYRIVNELSYADQISAIDEEVNRLESAFSFNTRFWRVFKPICIWLMRVWSILAKCFPRVLLNKGMH
jgi:hypothetical protein